MYYIQDLQSLNPDLTPEIMTKVNEVIERYNGKPGCLIPVLEECQAVVGYLPQELQDYIARELNIPGSTVYGVVTFYSFFSMVPKGRHTIKVCLGTACYVRGIAEVINRLKSELNLEVGATTEDRRFSLEAVRCLGACGLAPVVVVDNDTHGGVSPETILKILERYE
ncbi:MAG: NADH-quinone oxidoreductase subunit NuoE [Deltaproteobacteria bacterium]|nr:NADH-quinone oxidoreductase subunit NuoE [Deltaproteobacteria bacterium]